MRHDIVLDPAAWEGVEAGTEALLDRWLADEGASVAEGEPVVRVVLVKSTIDVPAPAAGRLAAIEVRAGDTFARGRVLGRIEAG